MSKVHSRRSFLKMAAVGSVGLAAAACQTAATGPTAAPPSGGAATSAATSAATGAATTAATSASGAASGAGTETPQAGAPGEKQKITFSMYGHPGLVEKMVPLFNDSQSQVEVQFERSEGQ